jgi:UDP-GlcNAc:undecaprenyl-phosphate/decaprenyl-phosphate GlcNAc-1-phosphate transferase
VSTAALVWALTALQVRWSPLFQLVAVPRADRWHSRPTPKSGGIAMFIAAAVAYAIWFRGEHQAIAFGAAALFALGLVDDLLRLPPSVKLLGQVCVITAVMASGIVSNATSSPALNLIFTFLWLVGLTNAFNLIDNMDGLCAGVVVIISGFHFGLLAMAGSWNDARFFVLIGAVYFGFLLLNYRPARIFMGDCGSMLAGFSLAALTIATPVPHPTPLVAGMLYPALAFIYPIFDTILVSVLRRAAGRPISEGGRDHSSHRLVSLGISESRVVWMLWALTAVGPLAGLILYSIPTATITTSALLGLLLASFGIFLGKLPVFPMVRPSAARLPEGSGSRGAVIAKITRSIRGLLKGVSYNSGYEVPGRSGSRSGVPLRRSGSRHRSC